VRRSAAEIDLIAENAQTRVRTEVGRDLLRPRFVDANLCGPQSRVRRLEAVASFLPRQRFWAKPMPADTAISNPPRHDRLTTRRMKPPCLIE
jgi:hypothetical protein